MSDQTTVAVIEYTDHHGEVRYFDDGVWADIELPSIRANAGRYLFTNESLTCTGDHKNGSFSVDFGGGETIWYAWRLLTLDAQDAANTRIIGCDSDATVTERSTT